MVKAVFFDIDDTLYSYTEAHKPALKAMKEYAARELGVSEDAYDDYVRQAQAVVKRRVGRDCSTLHNRLIRFQCMLEILGRPIFPHAEVMGKLYWDTLIDHMQEEEGAGELLKTLKERGYYVGIGTNMTAGVQFRKLTKLGFGPWIDGMVTSEEAGVQKPDPKLFLLCAEKAGVSPEKRCTGSLRRGHEGHSVPEGTGRRDCAGGKLPSSERSGRLHEGAGENVIKREKKGLFAQYLFPSWRGIGIKGSPFSFFR